MRILLSGATGQLGREICRARLPAGTSLLAASRSGLDLARPEGVAAFVDRAKPDLIINAAAYTAVDGAEAEPDLAFAINCHGAEALAKAAALRHVPIIHFSTDYVFDGRKHGEWREDDDTHPLNMYGKSKRAGEIAVAAANPRHLILRVSWLYSAHGRNFLKTLLRLGRERSRLSIVGDQIGRPTSAADLAEAAMRAAMGAIESDSDWGLYHFSNSGAPVSWHGFATEIFRRAAPWPGTPPRIEAITTQAFNATAARPQNSVLNLSNIKHTFGIEPQSWQSALADVLKQLHLETVEREAS
jgi:dTDP-4-dehydrorhamnose reductase